MGPADLPPNGDFAAVVLFRQAGDLEAAYRRALERDPRHADALNLLGATDHQRVHSLAPRRADVLNNLGIASRSEFPVGIFWASHIWLKSV